MPTPEPTPEPTPKDEDEDGEICSVTKWWRNCTTPDNGRRLADTQGDEGYWKVQNSWGTGWGDEGFAKIAITGGSGVCGMNSYLQYVDWTDDAYTGK